MLPASFWNDERRRLLTMLGPVIEGAALAGAAAASANLGGTGLDYALTNEQASAWARQYTDSLLDQLGATSERLAGAARRQRRGGRAQRVRERAHRQAAHHRRPARRVPQAGQARRAGPDLAALIGPQEPSHYQLELQPALLDLEAVISMIAQCWDVLLPQMDRDMTAAESKHFKCLARMTCFFEFYSRNRLIYSGQAPKELNEVLPEYCVTTINDLTALGWM